MEEPERYREDGMRRLLAIGGVWFLYNFLIYPFNMYSSYIIDLILPAEEVLSPCNISI